MESIKKYTLTVFNTCTQEYEEVAVTEEVYRAYYRTGWNIKDNILTLRILIWSLQRMNKILFICHGNICRSPMAELEARWPSL